MVSGKTPGMIYRLARDHHGFLIEKNNNQSFPRTKSIFFFNGWGIGQGCHFLDIYLLFSYLALGLYVGMGLVHFLGESLLLPLNRTFQLFEQIQSKVNDPNTQFPGIENILLYC